MEKRMKRIFPDFNDFFSKKLLVNILLKQVHSTLCGLCETFVALVVKKFNHKEHQGFTKATKRRVYKS